ncbi:hypothetical protein [Moorena bouillonii]|nr:hypothetical protein [Moorena bouillonii]
MRTYHRLEACATHATRTAISYQQSAFEGTKTRYQNLGIWPREPST